MKIVKTIFKYLLYGVLIFFITGIMASMITNSDSNQTSKKIFM